MYKSDIRFEYETTKEYRYKYESQCDCAYCRNYYESFKKTYPKTTELMEEFGLDVNFPLEIMPLEYNREKGKMGYISYYPIKGILDKDKKLLLLEELELRILKGSYSNNPCPNPKMNQPYLLLEVSGIRLPWVLNEDAE